MNKNCDTLFQNEIERILKELYYEPANPNGKDKRKHFETERKYVQYLIDYNLVKDLNMGGKGYFLILERRGYEVFELYVGWHDYRKRVIEKEHKIEDSKKLAQRFWWLPIIISIISILISLLVIFKK